MVDKNLAGMLDQTLLKPEATSEQIDALCAEAKQYGFFAVCVNPVWVPRAVAALEDCATVVATVAGFPLGASKTEIKVAEARQAVAEGAAEVDMVGHLGALLGGDTAAYGADVAAVVKGVRETDKRCLVKVILETSLLTATQIADACGCCVDAGAHFVKTSTGFHPTGGASIEAVRMLARHAPGLGVKAAGGIRDRATALAMIEAGATRIGTSSGRLLVASD